MCPLRKPNINYFRGWFFVTMQVAKNQSVFGLIGDRLLQKALDGQDQLGSLIVLFA